MTRWAAILGATVTKGARSPHLWNAAFDAHGAESRMKAIDVTPEELSSKLAGLDADPDFLGGALAVPHKETTARWLGERVDEKARPIGAVNCLYRGKDGRLWGTNTDGEAALLSFEKRFGPVKGKKVALLGPGGAGKAVSAFFKAAGAHVYEFSRSGGTWGKLSDTLPSADAVVNCTSVGHGAAASQSPLTAEQVALLPKTCVLMDIIYQPSPTRLMELARARGLSTLDGSEMNLEQAVLAFGRAAEEPLGRPLTRQAMEAAKRALDAK